jgi:FADH2 O2-dependent halogenase
LIRSYDVAVFGSGFGGSLTAMIARRLGYSVLLLERKKHPRFAIGESSTPLANLILDELVTKYDLPRIKPLTKWGSWQRTYPDLPCGLKRGFTFFHHAIDQERSRSAERQKALRTDELLVAASPRDEIADTHWYREDFDAFLVKEAQEVGVVYADETEISNFTETDKYLQFDVARGGTTDRYRAKFVVDATGPRGLIHQKLEVSEYLFPGHLVTQGLYSHFAGVRRPRHEQAERVSDGRPYPPEDAAVHHVFDGGWIWVLRFNNGVTSSGVAVTAEKGAELQLRDKQSAWEKLLSQLPEVEEQFSSARAVQPFTFIPRLSFMSERPSGNRWAMLPSSAGFIDPLLSTGFPLTLLGIERLARIMEQGIEASSRPAQLAKYSVQTKEELLITARLVRALYANMGNFKAFKAISLLYFAAASYSETARRLNKPELASAFLLLDRPEFAKVCESLLQRANTVKAGAESDLLIADILEAIGPFDVAGLGKSTTRSWYPVVAEDLLSSAAKVGVTRFEVDEMLSKSGFYCS